jgi:methionyl-tRNA synthetase
MNVPEPPNGRLELKDFYRRQIESAKKDCEARGNRCEDCLHKYCLEMKTRVELKGE